MNKLLTFDQLPNAVSLLSEKLDSIERLLQERNQSTQPDFTEQFLTIHEAAEFMSLTVPTIYSKVSRGELPVMKRGKRLYFSRIELMEYLKEGRKKSNTEIEKETSIYLTSKKRN
jgi:excisionase family DNA binding protein